jgi:hypothetical protein
MNLFGLTNTTTLKELKRKYYDFALLCHPDNGGSTEDMQVVQSCYEEAKQQLEWTQSSHDKMDRLVDALECGTLRDDLPHSEANPSAPSFPSLRDIFDDVHSQFHAICHQTTPDAPDGVSGSTTPGVVKACGPEEDPYATQGYGSYMLERWKMTTDASAPCVYSPDVNVQTELSNIPSSAHDDTKDDKMVVCPSQTTSFGYPLHINPHTHIRDFSVSDNLFAHTQHATHTGSLPKSDYRLAHAEPEKPPTTE